MAYRLTIRSAEVFALLDPQQLETCLVSWSEQLRIRTGIKGEEVIALDGKVLRHSFDNAMGVPAIHIVSAWASRARLCLAQVKVAEKSNEITAVPILLKMLDIEDCIVTADALNCQTANCRTNHTTRRRFRFGSKGQSP